MEKYIHYNITDFIEDESFIRWAKDMALKEDFEWDKWLENNSEKKPLVNEAKAFINGISFDKIDVPSQKEDSIWENINNSIESSSNETAKVKKLNPRRRRIIYAIAAVILLFIISINVLPNSYDQNIQTSFAESKSITLPDGSSVEVNSLSSVQYDSDDWNKNRLIILDGEAFFDVKKGSQFIVKTKNGTVEVLGTSFNVYSRGKRLSVLCTSGKVEVSSSSKSVKRTIMPNQLVEIKDNKEIFKEKISTIENRSTWRQGIYRYNNESLLTVTKEIERQLDVEVVLPKELESIKFTGSFNKNNKEDSFSEVFWPLGLKYEKEGRKVYVSE